MSFVLREIRETDLADIVEACNDPTTQRFLPLLPFPYTEADARVFMNRNGAWQRIVADPDTDRLLGTVGLEERGAGEAELGYWTAPWARGRGVATAAAGRLTARAFEAGFVRVYVRVALDNGPSQRVALSAGFQREGVSRGGGRRRDGHHYDLVVWARLAGDPAGPTRRLLPDLPDDRLTDGVVTLRPLRVTDTDDTLELRARPDVSARSVSAVGPDRAAIEQMCANAEARWLSGELAALTIRDAATDAYAGEIGFFYSDPQVQQAMIGYSLAPAVARARLRVAGRPAGHGLGLRPGGHRASHRRNGTRQRCVAAGPRSGRVHAGGVSACIATRAGRDPHRQHHLCAVHRQADDAVVVGPAAVDHARPPRLLVVEQEEVVAEQFHVEERVVDRHRLSGVLLIPHDVPWLVVGLLT